MKEKSRGRTVITDGIHDWEAVWHAYVECQLSENGKYVSETSLQWQICRRHSKDGNRVCGNRKDDKYVKTPIEESVGVRTTASIRVGNGGTKGVEVEQELREELQWRPVVPRSIRPRKVLGRSREARPGSPGP